MKLRVPIIAGLVDFAITGLVVLVAKSFWFAEVWQILHLGPSAVFGPIVHSSASALTCFHYFVKSNFSAVPPSTVVVLILWPLSTSLTVYTCQLLIAHWRNPRRDFKITLAVCTGLAVYPLMLWIVSGDIRNCGDDQIVSEMLSFYVRRVAVAFLSISQLALITTLPFVSFWKRDRHVS